MIHIDPDLAAQLTRDRDELTGVLAQKAKPPKPEVLALIYIGDGLRLLVDELIAANDIAITALQREDSTPLRRIFYYGAARCLQCIDEEAYRCAHHLEDRGSD